MIAALKRIALSAVLLLPSCTSQVELDRTALELAAATCRIRDFKITPSEHDRGSRSSISPFRWLGDRWLERRRRQQGVTRRYRVNVEAEYGLSISSSRADALAHQRFNRKIDCLGRQVSNLHIDVVSAFPILLN